MSCEIQEPSSAVNDMVVVLTQSAELLFSDPVMELDLIFPGAGYVEVVFSANERGGPLVLVTCSLPCSAIESMANNFIFHAQNSSLCPSQIKDRNYVEF